MQSAVYFESLGCAKNQVDTEIMLAKLLGGGFVVTNDPTEAQVIIINTCGFLTSAVEESINRILELSPNRSEQCKALVVAGCMVQRYGDQLKSEIPEVDAVIGTSDYTQILTLVSQILGQKEQINLLEKRPQYNSSNQSAERVITGEGHYCYLKISEGCSNMCSFCNIPFLRGTFQHKSQEAVWAESKLLLQSGIKEINIIGQDTSAYESKGGLLELVQGILDQNQSPDYWLRLLYSYPNTYNTGLFDLMAQDPRLCSYADIPIQHFSDPILKAMNRKITGAEIKSLFETAKDKAPDIALRSTIIVGFPGETEQNFKELLGFVEEGWLDHLGVFVYSDEDNIPSNKLDKKVPEELASEREQILAAAQQEVSYKKNQRLIGKKCQILLEGLSEETDLLLQGRSQSQAAQVDGVTLINDGEGKAGDFVTVEITDAHPYDVVGRIIE